MRKTNMWLLLVMVTLVVLPAAVIYWGVQDATRDHSKYQMVTTTSETNILGLKVTATSTREVPIEEQH
jgi:CHASE3 domain sensor protein